LDGTEGTGVSPSVVGSDSSNARFLEGGIAPSGAAATAGASTSSSSSSSSSSSYSSGYEYETTSDSRKCIEIQSMDTHVCEKERSERLLLLGHVVRTRRARSGGDQTHLFISFFVFPVVVFLFVLVVIIFVADDLALFLHHVRVRRTYIVYPTKPT